MAEIIFRPICSECKNLIFSNIDINYGSEELMYEESDERYRKIHFMVDKPTISPPFCPYCGAYFSSIQMPTKIPFKNDIGLMKADMRGETE